MFWNRFWSVNLENLTSLTWLQKILCLILLKACSLLRMVLWQIFIRPPEMKQAKLICSMIKIVERFPVMQGTTIQSLPRDHSNWNRAALELLSAIPFSWRMKTGWNISGALPLLSCVYPTFSQTRSVHFPALDMNTEFQRQMLPGVIPITLFLNQMIRW